MVQPARAIIISSSSSSIFAGPFICYLDTWWAFPAPWRTCRTGITDKLQLLLFLVQPIKMTHFVEAYYHTWWPWRPPCAPGILRSRYTLEPVAAVLLCRFSVLRSRLSWLCSTFGWPANETDSTFFFNMLTMRIQYCLGAGRISQGLPLSAFYWNES